jgi:hypothetical protein
MAVGHVDAPAAVASTAGAAATAAVPAESPLLAATADEEIGTAAPTGAGAALPSVEPKDPSACACTLIKQR